MCGFAFYLCAVAVVVNIGDRCGHCVLQADRFWLRIAEMCVDSYHNSSRMRWALSRFLPAAEGMSERTKNSVHSLVQPDLVRRRSK